MSIITTSATRLAADYEQHGVVQLNGLLSHTEINEIRDVFMTQVDHDRSIAHDDSIPDDDVLARYPRFVHPHRRTDLENGRLASLWML